MNIPEAIRVQNILKEAPILKDTPSVIGALNLGIEALKFTRSTRKRGFLIVDELLPGETQD